VARMRGRSGIVISLGVLLVVLVGLLILVPPEQTLGDIVKVVFLHGALVQVGLVAFAVAGALGLAYCIRRSETVYAWCLAVQKTAVLMWIVYAISSMIATYQAWGVWIAWDEPRVRASISVLWFSVICLLLVLWIRHRLFTAALESQRQAAVIPL